MHESYDFHGIIVLQQIPAESKRKFSRRARPAQLGLVVVRGSQDWTHCALIQSTSVKKSIEKRRAVKKLDASRVQVRQKPGGKELTPLHISSSAPCCLLSLHIKSLFICKSSAFS